MILFSQQKHRVWGGGKGTCSRAEVICVFDPSTWKIEAGRLVAQGQSGLQEILSQDNRTK